MASPSPGNRGFTRGREDRWLGSDSDSGSEGSPQSCKDALTGESPEPSRALVVPRSEVHRAAIDELYNSDDPIDDDTN